MNVAGVPDLPLNLRLQRATADASRRLSEAGTELSTGVRSDLVAASGGDPARLMGIETERSRAARAVDAAALAGGRAAAAQAALAALSEQTGTIGVALEAAVARGDTVAARRESAGAKAAFETAVSALNTRFGGRSLFAGAAVDGPALAPAADILDAVRAITAASPDAATAIAGVDAWFAPGSNFDAVAYLGAAEDAPRATLDGGATVALSPRADDAAMRAGLKGLALAALAHEGAFGGPPAEIAELHAAAGRATAEARTGLVDAAAELGAAEQRIAEAGARASARRVSLDIAWNGIAARDPYEAAAEFQALEQQLQTVFTVTARMSRLSLAGFLR